MKKNSKKEKNTMSQSDFISDPFFDSFKRQIDESLDLEDIKVSEDLIQSTLRAIQIKKETALHEDDSVSAEDENTISGEEENTISGEKKYTISGKEESIISVEEEKQIRLEKQSKNKRNIIKYIGTWGSVVAASIILFYLGGQGIFTYFIENRVMQEAETGASDTSSKYEFGSLAMDRISPESSEEMTLNDSAQAKGDGITEDEAQKLKEDPRINFTDGGNKQEENSSDQSPQVENKVTVTTQDTLNGNADSKTESQMSTSGMDADGVSKKAYDYAVEDIELWTNTSTVNINFSSDDEVKIKDIMLLMTSQQLRLTTEDPVGDMKYSICISFSEEDAIVYFINAEEVLIKTYGNEGLVTSTSYEVDETYDLIQAVEDIIN